MDTPPPIAQEVPAPQMSVTCPHCQARLQIPPSQAGTAVTCPKCGGNFQAPLPTAQSGTYAPASNLPPEVRDFASKKIAAGICGILLGGLGVHKFILGFNNAGIIMLVVTVAGIALSCLVVPIFGAAAMGIIGLVEGIIYLTKSDEDFYQTYAVQKKAWF